MMMELIDIKCLGKKSYGNLHIHYFSVYITVIKQKKLLSSFQSVKLSLQQNFTLN